jgi:hypothetical protein
VNIFSKVPHPYLGPTVREAITKKSPKLGRRGRMSQPSYLVIFSGGLKLCFCKEKFVSLKKIPNLSKSQKIVA